MKISNESIQIKGYKDNNLVMNKTVRNRILNNYLDYLAWNISPAVNKNTLFPKFALRGQLDNPIQYVYIKLNTTQTITDTSTSMTYDLKIGLETISNDIGTVSNNSYYDIVENNDISAIIDYVAKFTIFSGYDGDVITEIGFGLNDGVGDFLMAHVDVSFLGIVISSEVEYDIVRRDTLTSNAIAITGDIAEHLTNTSELQSFKLFYNDTDFDEFEVDDVALSYSVTGIGSVEVTGFPNFKKFRAGLLPRTRLYPSSRLFPRSRVEEYNKTNFKFNFNEMESEYMYLDCSYDDTVLKIQYKYERGDS